MFFIHKKLIFLFFIYLNQHFVSSEHLKGYYFSKSANKYFKIESTSTTIKPTRFTISIKSTTLSTTPSTTTTTATTTTTENVKRNDDLMKTTITQNIEQPNERQSNNQTMPMQNIKLPSNQNYDQEFEIERPKINMLDFISGMSKAINLLLFQRDSSTIKGNLEPQESSIREENQTTTREPISIFRPLKVNSKIPPEGYPSDYRAQAELLRQQVLRRCSQLQQIIGTTNEILRERENHMFAKILDNFSTRIEFTKKRADLILKDTSTSVAAVKALNRINYGLNNMNHLVQNVLSRVNLSINLDLKENQKETKREAKRVKDSKSVKKEKKTNSEKVQ